MAYKIDPKSSQGKLFKIPSRIWECVRQLPEYKNDFNLKIKNKDRLKRKWGFFPLCDPGKRSPSGQFIDCIDSRFLRKLLKDVDAIEPLNFSKYDLIHLAKGITQIGGRKIPNTKPRRMEVAIDYTHSKIAIKRQMADLVGLFQKAYGEETVTDEKENFIKGMILRIIGYSKQAIENYFQHHLDDECETAHERDNKRNKINRIVKKIISADVRLYS